MNNIRCFIDLLNAVVYIAFEKAPRMVNTCPHGVSKVNTIESMCNGPQGKRTISTYMPVVSSGILHRNMRHAACHALALQQVQPVASYGLYSLRERRYIYAGD